MSSSSFQRLPECRICLYYTCDLHLQCAVHPSGVLGDSCPDFMPLAQAQPRPMTQPVDRSWKDNPNGLPPEKQC